MVSILFQLRRDIPPVIHSLVARQDRFRALNDCSSAH
jgi:hypothetical protein